MTHPRTLQLIMDSLRYWIRDMHVDNTLMILVNAYHEPIDFVLPAHPRGARWEILLDTRGASGQRRHRALRGGASYDLAARCLAMLRLVDMPSTSRSPGRDSST